MSKQEVQPSVSDGSGTDDFCYVNGYDEAVLEQFVGKPATMPTAP